METNYEKIDCFGLPYWILGEFEQKKLPDNSVLLTRYKTSQDRDVIIDRQGDYRDDTRRYTLEIPVLRREIDAVVILYRTSANHYGICGSTSNQTKFGYAKSLKEVGEFISHWFCRTLLNDN